MKTHQLYPILSFKEILVQVEEIFHGLSLIYWFWIYDIASEILQGIGFSRDLVILISMPCTITDRPVETYLCI